MRRSMSNSICNSVVYRNSPLKVTSSHSNYSESDNCKQDFLKFSKESVFISFLTLSLLENTINSSDKLSLRFSSNNQLLLWTLYAVWAHKLNFAGHVIVTTGLWRMHFPHRGFFWDGTRTCSRLISVKVSHRTIFWD